MSDKSTPETTYHQAALVAHNRPHAAQRDVANIGRSCQRQTVTLRLPETVYFGALNDMHEALREANPDNQRYSNSVAFRLGLWAWWQLFELHKAQGSLRRFLADNIELARAIGRKRHRAPQR